MGEALRGGWQLLGSDHRPPDECRLTTRRTEQTVDQHAVGFDLIEIATKGPVREPRGDRLAPLKAQGLRPKTGQREADPGGGHRRRHPKGTSELGTPGGQPSERSRFDIATEAVPPRRDVSPVAEAHEAVAYPIEQE